MSDTPISQALSEVLSSYDARIAELSSQTSTLSAAVENGRERIAGLQTALDEAEDKLADLGRMITILTEERDYWKGRYEGHMAEHEQAPAPEPEPEPKPLLLGAAFENNKAIRIPVPLWRIYHTADANYGGGGGGLSGMLENIQRSWAAGSIPLVSVKPQSTGVAWSDFRNGGRDAWTRRVLTDISNATPDGRQTWLCVHHEPCDEIINSLPSGYDTQRLVDYQHMTRVIGTIAKEFPKIKFGAIIMGYHTFNTKRIPIETYFPESVKSVLEFFGIDVYEAYKDIKGGTKWTPFEKTYYQPLREWAGDDLLVGQGETAVSAQAFADDPQWFEKQKALADQYLDFWCYWDNVVKKNGQPDPAKTDWRLTGPREPAFRAMLAD